LILLTLHLIAYYNINKRMKNSRQWLQLWRICWFTSQEKTKKNTNVFQIATQNIDITRLLFDFFYHSSWSEEIWNTINIFK
jgi:hypothetical protein